MLNDDGIQMIVNLTNPAAHYAVTRQALERGKHVYSEKMLAVTLEEARALCRLASARGLRLGVAPDTFLGAGAQTAKYLVDHGVIGQAESFIASLGRDYRILGERLPHLYKKGGTILYDTGCYYLTALCAMLGPVERLSARGTVSNPARTGVRMGAPGFGTGYRVEDYNILAAVLEFSNGAIGTLHLNGETNFGDTVDIRLFGSRGILCVGDMNLFGAPVRLEKPFAEGIVFPFTHGYRANARGLGAAELAWSLLAGRPHRAGMELGLHVLEVAHGITASAQTGKEYRPTTAFEPPPPLPDGFIGTGDDWGPTEESALV
jgi:predicted dehydrogenase